MKVAYTFATLRYIHDVATGEFVNVGVGLFAPGAKFLGMRTTASYVRLSGFFHGSSLPPVRRLVKHVERSVAQIATEIGQSGLETKNPEEVGPTFRAIVDRILPVDDSALQFSELGGGSTADPVAMLDQLFERFVERYATAKPPTRRTDDQVLKTFEDRLTERDLAGALQRKTIVGPEYKHEFPVAWKNGIWHAAEAASFDLVEPESLADKANRWVGRALSLQASGEQFKLHLLLGAPQDPALREHFEKAKRILERMPVAHHLVEESEADSFVDYVEQDLKAHRAP